MILEVYFLKTAMRSLKILFVSTSVGALSTGLGGGVELTLKNLAIALFAKGHSITVVAPEGSKLEGFSIVEIPGNLQVIAQSQGRDAPIAMPANSVLANMWEYARTVQDHYDVVVNFAYDWLPFYLTPFFTTPIAHLVSMGSLSEAMDNAIISVAQSFSHRIAVHSRAQADSFERRLDKATNLQNGFDLSAYSFCDEPADYFAFVGRIAPEKGLEDAVAATIAAAVPLKIWGVIHDPVYWDKIQADYPAATIAYEGFLPTDELSQALSRAKALIMTPKWVEAFGNVAIEALACGVPVIAYRRGGPSEIVKSGETGFLVMPDDVQGLVEAIGRIEKIKRSACREDAEARYSLEAMGDRAETWLGKVVGSEK
jgi:UDP-glucose:tetrahydrobiopterin glucosyltransferase